MMHTVQPDPVEETTSNESPVDGTAPLGDNEARSQGQTAIKTGQTSPASPALKPLNLDQKGSSTMKRPKKSILLVILLFPVLAGAATGFGLEKLTSKSSGGSFGGGQELQQVAGESINKGDVFGSPDESTFKDQAQGVLITGGIDGEGSHQLLRPGGESQTVYLTSSITDLDKFENMEIKIWGETFKGQKVGWLMDVGRVEVVNTDAELPEGHEE